MTGAPHPLRADERGMTLVELLVAMAIGGAVLAAALTMFLSGMGGAATVQDRSEAAQRARIGFDRVTTLIGAQVCNGVTNAGAPVVAADQNSVRFTANLGGTDDIPTGYELRYDSASQSLYEYEYPLTGSENVAGYRSWATAWTARRKLLERAVPESGTNVFRYYAATDATSGTYTELSPSGAALGADERARVLRVDLALRILPTRTQTLNDTRGTLMKTESYVTSNIVAGSLDQGPRC